jgi:hypothetical protein
MTEGIQLSLLEDKNDQCCELSCQTRMITAAVLAGLGVLLTVLAFVEFAMGDYAAFAILYTLSIIAALGSSFFVVGPKKHIARLKDEVAHLIALIVVLVCVVLVFVACLAVKGSGGTALAIILIIVQLIALAVFYLSMTMLTWEATKAICRKICSCAG